MIMLILFNYFILLYWCRGAVSFCNLKHCNSEHCCQPHSFPYKGVAVTRWLTL